MSTQSKPSTSSLSNAAENVNLNKDLSEVSLDNEPDYNKCTATSETEQKVSDHETLTLGGDNDERKTEKKEPESSLNSKDTSDFMGIFSSQKTIPRPFLDSEALSWSPKGHQKFPIVLKAELAGNWLMKHVLFVIRLPDGMEIKRRYSDFLWLRGWLTKIYIGAFIPPLPARLPVAMWPKGYLQTRKRGLQVFLKRCSITPFIVAEETWKMYLQSKNCGEFEKARKKWDKEHSNLTIRETSEHLEKTFSYIMNEPLPNLEENTLERRFEAMKEFVQDSLRILQRIFDSSKTLVDAYDAKVDSQMTMREELREYENLMKSRFSDESTEDQERLMEVFQKNPTHILKSIISWCHAMLEVPQKLEIYLVHNIKRNLMDLQALQDCIAERVKVLKYLYAARNKAAKWKKIEELRSKDVSQKHADELRQEELEILAKILYKLVTKQFIYVWQATQHMFSDSMKRLMILQVKKYDQLKQIWQSSIEYAEKTSTQ